MAVIGMAARGDPYAAFNFAVEVTGVLSAGFTEVSGLTSEIEVLEFREGGVNEYAHKLPGPTTYRTNLVLKRGVTDSYELWAWHASALAGKTLRRPISILLRDAQGQRRWRWSFLDAYPVKWVGPELRGGSAKIAIETLEFAHRGLVLPASGRA